MILNGSVEVTYPEGRTEILCMGNSFGVSPTMEKEYMKGVMKTKVDDCQVRILVGLAGPFLPHLSVKSLAQTCYLMILNPTVTSCIQTVFALTSLQAAWGDSVQLNVRENILKENRPVHVKSITLLA